MAASSAARAAPSSARDVGHACVPSTTRLPTCRWLSASAATCGRWVTQTTWWNAASARSRCPSAVAWRPPMPGVDLVEDEQRRLVGGGQDHLQRQGEAARLATRGDPAQRPCRLAGVRGEGEGDAVRAASDRPRCDSSSTPNASLRQPERRQLRVHAPGEARGRGGASRSSARAPARVAAACRSSALGRRRVAQSILVGEAVQLTPPHAPKAITASHARSVLALAGRGAGSAAPPAAARVAGSSSTCSAATDDVARQLGGLGHQAGRPLGELGEPLVVRRGLLQRRATPARSASSPARRRRSATRMASAAARAIASACAAARSRASTSSSSPARSAAASISSTWCASSSTRRASSARRSAAPPPRPPRRATRGHRGADRLDAGPASPPKRSSSAQLAIRARAGAAARAGRGSRPAAPRARRGCPRSRCDR